MFIKYKPKSERRQKTRYPVPTNIGDFMPGQVGGPFTRDSHIREARQYVANGDFVECDANGVEFGKAADEMEATTPTTKAKSGTRKKKGADSAADAAD